MTLRFLRRLALAALGALVLAPAALAQAPGPLKIAVIDPELIVPRLPEYATVQEQVRSIETQIGLQLKAKQDSATVIQQELRAMADSPVVDPAARQASLATLQRLLGELQTGEQQGLQILAREEYRALQPLLGKVSVAIETVSARDNIDIVFTPFSNNAPIMLYASDRVIDITVPVLNELGVSITEEELREQQAAQQQAAQQGPPPPAPAGN